jgi:hypothetical protein
VAKNIQLIITAVEEIPLQTGSLNTVVTPCNFKNSRPSSCPAEILK